MMQASLTTAGGRTLTYQYDAASNRTRVTHPDGVYFTYGYDALNRVTAMNENGVVALATYAYDDLSRRASVTLGNGTVVSYSYEPDSALDTLTNNLAATAQDVTFTFDYNRLNQITSNVTSNSAYAWTGHYNQTVNYQNNGLNQVTQVGAKAISHDANGNLTGDGVWAYSYDTENRLITAVGSGVSAAYAYDGLGRRVSKTGTGVAATWYLTDGDAMVAEYAAATGTTPLRRYVHGPGVDEPIVVYDGGGTASKRLRGLTRPHWGHGPARSTGTGKARSSPRPIYRAP
ncbi:MAG: hypothetical protein ACOY99_01200 [Pseudomonadota bacterium]